MYMNDLDLINIYMNMHLDCRILKQLMLWYMEILFYLYAYVHKYLFKKLSFLRDIYNNSYPQKTFLLYKDVICWVDPQSSSTHHYTTSQIMSGFMCQWLCQISLFYLCLWVSGTCITGDYLRDGLSQILCKKYFDHRHKHT